MDEVLSATVLLLLVGIVTPRFINQPQCNACSGRKDVPCKIQRIPYPCFLGEYSDKWPGVPRRLQVKQVFTVDKWVANFTWRAPYDASFTSLNGFMLSINIIWSFETTIHILDPYCFYANLTGTDWHTVVDPHSVVFHFDCVQIEVPSKANIHLRLESTPLPHDGAGHANVTFLLDGTGNKIRKESTSVMTINFKVNGNTVHVNFGPLLPNVSYHTVCLSPAMENYMSCYKTENVTQGINETTFRDVKPDNYTIMIVRAKGYNFFASKYFIVKEVQPIQTTDEISHLTIISITITVMCVAVATGLVFCIVRKRGGCVLPQWLHMCKRGLYEQTSQIIPNNTPDMKEGDAPILFPLYFDQSESFVKAVKDFCACLQKWTNYKIDFPPVCTHPEQIALMVKKSFSGQMIIVFLSRNMIALLNEIDQGLSINSQLISPHSQFLLQTLKSIDLKEITKCYVSLRPLGSEELIKGVTVFNITKEANKETGGCGLKISEDHVGELISKMNSKDLISEILHKEETSKLLKFISDIPVEDVVDKGLDNLISRQRYDSSDQGYISEPPVFNPAGHNYITSCGNFPPGNPTQQVCTGNSRRYGCDRNRNLNLPWAKPQMPHHERIQISALHHTENQNYYSSDFVSPVQCPYMMDPDPYGDHLESASVYTESGDSDKNCLQDLKPFQLQEVVCTGFDEVNSLTPEDKAKSILPVEDEWDPPESDTESDTMSTLYQKHMEINEKYMTTIQQK